MSEIEQLTDVEELVWRSARRRVRLAIAGGLIALAGAVAVFGDSDWAMVAGIVAGIYALKALLPW